MCGKPWQPLQSRQIWYFLRMSWCLEAVGNAPPGVDALGVRAHQSEFWLGMQSVCIAVPYSAAQRNNNKYHRNRLAGPV